jgi:putative membrane protein
LILDIDQQRRIKEQIRQIESQVFGEILVVLTSRVTPIRWISWMLPTLFSWIFLSAILFFGDPNFIKRLLAFGLGAGLGWGLSKLYIVQKLIIPDWIEQKFVQREALYWFFTHRVSQTPSRSGVLLFISLFERGMEVVVDEAIQSKMSPDDTKKIVDVALSDFKKGYFFDGIMKSLDECEQILKTHFQKPQAKENELHEELLLVDSSWD